MQFYKFNNSTLKVDLVILPTLCLIYMFCVVDRANIGYAKIIGKDQPNSLESSLNLSPKQVTLLSSLVLLSYLVFEVPSNLVMKKVQVQYWICFLTIGFAVANFSQAFANNFSTLAASRLVLGMFEAGVFPAIIFYMNFWYLKTQIAKRLSLYTFSSQIAGACGGLFVLFIKPLDGLFNLPAWKWVFIVFSVPPFLLAILGLFVLPKNPEKCKFINSFEREALAQKLIYDNNTTATDKFLKEELYSVFKLPQTYIYMSIFLLIYIPIYSMNFSLPTLLLYENYTEEKSLILCIPPYLLSAVSVFIAGFSSDKFLERGFHSTLGIALACLGFVGILLIDNYVLRYILYNVIIIGASISIPIIISWISNNSKGATRTATGITLIIFCGNLGGFVGGNLYSGKSGTDLITYVSHVVNFVCLLIASILCIFLKIYFKKMNEKINSKKSDGFSSLEQFIYTL